MKPENPFIQDIAPGHALMSYDHGEGTRDVVEDVIKGIRSANLGDVKVLAGRRIVYAVQGEGAPNNYNTELTGLLRGAGNDTRVVLFPTDTDPAVVQDRLKSYLGAELLGRGFVVHDPKDLIVDPTSLIARANNLATARMPIVSISSDDE